MTASLFPSSTASSSLHLPAFQTLLIKGAYHPSVPIHLCLSHLASRPPDSKAMLLTPSRQSFVSALVEYNDGWISERAGFGSTTSVSSRIDVLYPPTPAHLAVLLSLLHPQQTGEHSFNHKTALNPAPSLIVLHELSSYFLSENSDTFTLSSYLTLVSHALAASRHLSMVRAVSAPHLSAVSVALVDSRLDELRLPLTRHIQNLPEDAIEAAQGPERECDVLLPVSKYFEWIGTVEEDMTDTIRDSVEPPKEHMRLVLAKRGQVDDIVWTWSTRLGPEQLNTDRRCTVTDLS